MTKAATVKEYVEQHEGWHATTMKKLLRLVKKAAPNSIGEIKWKQPVFSVAGPMTSVKTGRSTRI